MKFWSRQLSKPNCNINGQK
uniref:Uncharacterized protein n=1 Tax=Arundo donax TaxID=35708 RepID=A0A0A9FYY3_ARUDO